MAKGNVYDWITERIIKALEQGVVPWRCPWLLLDRPMNLISGKAYNGVNIWSLLIAGEKYTSRYWVTAKQAKDRGGHVRKGEKSSMVVKYSITEKKKNGVVVRNSKGNPEKSFFLRYSNVFNVEQCEGIEYPKPEENRQPIDTLEVCENIIGGFTACPPITHQGGRAFYRSSDDSITMPKRDTFDSSPEYYSTLFHECVHSTGHKSRLNRKLENGFGSSDYAREELVAEMGAAMLCAVAGIECKTLDNSASYIATWLKRLRDDSKLIVKAASQAQKAAEYMQGIEAPKYATDSANEVARNESDTSMARNESDTSMALA